MKYQFIHSVNSKRTNFVLFGSKQKTRKLQNVEIFLDNIKITRTETAKFLGVVIDENLTWKNHINYIENKIAKNVGIIKRVRYLLLEKTLNTLYNTLVLPNIKSYGLIISRLDYSPCTAAEKMYACNYK